MFASVGTSRLAGQEWAGTCSLVLVHRVQSGRRGQGHVR